MGEPTWLGDWSVRAVRQVVATSAPALAGARMVLAAVWRDGNPEWPAGSSVVAGSFLAKLGPDRRPAGLTK